MIRNRGIRTSIHTSVNHFISNKAMSETSVTSLDRVEAAKIKKREKDKERMQAKRQMQVEALSLLSLPEKEKAILEAKEKRKVYDANAYQNKKRKAEALTETARTIEPARRKHDQAYSQRKAADGRGRERDE